jgi:hypothetical protein
MGLKIPEAKIIFLTALIECIINVLIKRKKKHSTICRITFILGIPEKAFIGKKNMNNLNDNFEASRIYRGSRHIIKDQIIQGDDYVVDGVRRSFWSNPDKSHSCHLFKMVRGEIIDRITVDSFEGETLNEFIQRTETILLGGK